MEQTAIGGNELEPDDGYALRPHSTHLGRNRDFGLVCEGPPVMRLAGGPELGRHLGLRHAIADAMLGEYVPWTSGVIVQLAAERLDERAQDL